MTSAPGFVCPKCKGPIAADTAGYECTACSRRYPIVNGIPDFRLRPDPYVDFEADRRKAAWLHAESATRDFESLVRLYYGATPEDPPDLADHWTRHHLAEVPIADALLTACGLDAGRGRTLLDLGCSTGGLVIAAARRGWSAVGIDVALRWLTIGARRLKDAGVSMTLVCANAEHLPFPARSLDAVTANDLLEHVDDPVGAAAEARRVSAAGGTIVFTANNRYAPLPEPQLHLWGVTQMPRRWQARYVAWRRPDVHRYRLWVPSEGELARALRRAGFDAARVEPAPLIAPHWSARANRVLAAYNALRMRPVIRQMLLAVGPRLLVRASPGATASPE